MTEFFRHCPECGRRFHIKLVEKKLLSVKEEMLRNKQVQLEGVQGIFGGGAPAYMTLMEGPPITAVEDEFQYSYKCGHCGHEWSEKRTKRVH